MKDWQERVLKLAEELKEHGGTGITDEMGASLEEMLEYADKEEVTKKDIADYLDQSVEIAESVRRDVLKVMGK